MSDYPRLSKAPIILAVLEVRFKAPDTLTIKKLGGLKPLFKTDFPNQITRNTAQLQFDPNVKMMPVDYLQDAYVFNSASKKHEILITNYSFTFFQHGSYDTWKSFKELALDAWSRCNSFIKSIQIDRLSLRYVNSIEIPYPPRTEQLQANFFNTSIVGPSTGKSIAQYFLRFSTRPGQIK